MNVKGQLLHILIFLFSFLILTRFSFDPDLGWHLAVGTRFLERGEIIRGDIFTWTMPGYLWGNRYFIYQILAAFLFSNLGYVMTTIIFGLIGSLAVFLIIPKKLDIPKMAAVFLGVGVAVVNLGFRPHTISFLLFAILLVLLSKKFFLGKTQAFFWFVFFALWANFHQAFFVGIFTLAAFIVIDFLWQMSKRQKGKQNFFPLTRILCIVAAIFGGLLTPFHGRLWGSIADDLFGGKTWTSIAEWQPIVIYLPWSLLYGVSGLVFAYILFKKFREVEPVWLLLSAFIFMLPFLATNFVFFWAAIFIFIATRHLEVEVNFSGVSAKIPLIFSSAAAGIALLLGFFLGVAESVDLENRLRRDGYPVEAVEFLKKEDLGGRIFNSYGWGGYLDWQLPATRVFIDGRMTGWRKENGGYILVDFVEILGGNCDLARKYDIKLVLMEKDFKNECFSDFNQIYQDPVAKILVKG